VSVAAALLLYEAQRQRRDAGMYAPRPLQGEEWQRTLFRWAHPILARRFDGDGRPYPALDPDGRILTD